MLLKSAVLHPDQLYCPGLLCRQSPFYEEARASVDQSSVQAKGKTAEQHPQLL